MTPSGFFDAVTVCDRNAVSYGFLMVSYGKWRSETKNDHSIAGAKLVDGIIIASKEHRPTIENTQRAIDSPKKKSHKKSQKAGLLVTSTR